MPECPTSPNQIAIDESEFWSDEGLNWSTHRIGWAIAGGCALLTCIISMISILSHCRNYTNRRQQRQILRILYMPPLYSIISWLSYRFFRYYYYYVLIYIGKYPFSSDVQNIVDVYQAIALSAFMLLLIEYVASTATGNSADKALERKDKRPLPIPFCCWRYRPTKAYFMYTVKWSVLQYVIIRPTCSVVSIICEKMDVLCHTEGFSWRWAYLYIESINFISISVALYGLLVFHGLMSEELKGKRPGMKFLAIKLVVMLTFYQNFMFTWMQGRVIHETEFWTVTNISNGLNALAVCIEMVFFAALMWWAYTSKEYLRPAGTPPTSIWKPLLDSINYMDFVAEIASAFRFYAHGRKHERRPPGSSKEHSTRRQTMFDNRMDADGPRMDFGEAFGVYRRVSTAEENEMLRVKAQEMGTGGSGMEDSQSPDMAYQPYAPAQQQPYRGGNASTTGPGSGAKYTGQRPPDPRV